MVSGLNFAKLDDNSYTKTTIANAPSGIEAFLLAEIVQYKNYVAYISSDERQLTHLKKILSFTAPEVQVLTLPAWDCLPYDRISPSRHISASRLSTFFHLLSYKKTQKPIIVLTTVNAMMQKSISPEIVKNCQFSLRRGDQINLTNIAEKLEKYGFENVNIVREAGDYVVRGGILDIYIPGTECPVRLDFFGNTLESLRCFNPQSQRTFKEISSIEVYALSEVILTPEKINLFRKKYLSNFGAVIQEDPFYLSISEGRRYPGMEHWLPLFYENLETTFFYLSDFYLVTDSSIKEAAEERSNLIYDYFEARRHFNFTTNTKKDSIPYKPISPEDLYLDNQQFNSILNNTKNTTRITAFHEEESNDHKVISLKAKPGNRWTQLISGKLLSTKDTETSGVIDQLIEYINKKNPSEKKILICAWSEGSLQHFLDILKKHGNKKIESVNSWSALKTLRKDIIGASVLPLEAGFETENLLVISEKDVFGDRMIRRSRRQKQTSRFIFEATDIEEGTIVVHAEHGIGRFICLRTIQVAGASHACLELLYADDNKLFLPVENIELLSRYGSEDSTAVLDKLGGISWQNRKEQLKKQLRDIAQGLIDVAAKRLLRDVKALTIPQNIYEEFVSGFPYDETEDQLNAIEAVRNDLASGRPMDRLICGDVGFGKTEVALRCAFIAAMNGFQVAMIAPTTLLARQHFHTFLKRFSNFPIKIANVSRLVSIKELTSIKKEIAENKVDIVIGTHKLLGHTIQFSNLGLVIIDEEQHFGVKHKERLKELKNDVHILTLSATPIPRTLQLAMTGVRDLSLITIPPIDRVPIRTTISIFDSLLIRKTLMREHYRGGQSFYVCPRLSDLEENYEFLQSEMPELKVIIAHGKMPSKKLEDVMTAFYEGAYDILLCTSIVESGLDLPTANTIIVYRADMFGLAQLYQLRGRVGRSKVHAFALFTLPTNQLLTAAAEKRLKIFQSLNTLGAGFQLASHDLDIRGAGNLLGEEQSGHIKEVGFELYQKMLEETVAEIQNKEEIINADWSPQISIGVSVLFPEEYIPDINLRLQLYRRLGNISDSAEIDLFNAEMIDRFGPLPVEADHLLKIVYLKSLCRITNVAKIEAGPKGIVIHFRNKKFANPQALIEYVHHKQNKIKIRPDQSVFFSYALSTAEKRLTATQRIMLDLSRLIKT
ncbi:LOW QUALITY PROTEIN: Transcription-repair coupling factor [Liberibacter crescens BT-1]|uniref:Transcription-repair-coupling factor n=1 Tax=Liberibacter crescens (strain BT-1) TaxID=1215343 RepID=L0EVI3_LIBCB|nr:LOW QUALITY PROTEIN: Transcription-repair coupling factor [Liberibacter crescens BT-1]